MLECELKDLSFDLRCIADEDVGAFVNACSLSLDTELAVNECLDEQSSVKLGALVPFFGELDSGNSDTDLMESPCVLTDLRD